MQRFWYRGSLSLLLFLAMATPAGAVAIIADRLEIIEAEGMQGPTIDVNYNGAKKFGCQNTEVCSDAIALNPAPQNVKILKYNIYEDQQKTIVSDTLDILIDNNRNDLFLIFTSEHEGARPLQPLLNPTAEIIENGTLQRVDTPSYTDVNGDTHNLTVSVRSDIETVTIPEPATFLLLTTGLMGLLASTWCLRTRAEH